MKPYLDLLKQIKDEGTWQANRTGIDTVGLFGSVLRFNLQDGFPAVTTRKLAFKTFTGEEVGFLRASNSAADFRALGSNIWNQNANENQQWLDNPYRTGEDSLGRIYGVQWRKWRAYKTLTPGSLPYDAAISKGYKPIANVIDSADQVLFKEIDQLRECVDKIMNNPLDRRIIFHAWNPAELDEMALPPCHLLYMFQVNVEAKSLNLIMFQRSADVPLGVVGNVSNMAILLALVARLTGYVAAELIWVGADTHIYRNQLEMVEEQLKREPRSAPKLVISDRVPEYAKTGVYEPEWLDKVEPSDFKLEGYDPHPPLTAPMAV